MYCIDTSALLQAWRRDYPPDIFKSVWDQVDRLANDGRLSSPDEVLYELKRGGDEIYSWAEARKFIFKKPDAQVVDVVKYLVHRYRDKKFVPSISPDGFWADPYIIAMAKVYGLIVVTGEKPAGPNSKKVKIPDVCQDLHIEWINFLELIRREGWKF